MISVLGGLFYTTAKDDNNCLDQMLMMIFTKNLQAFISEFLHHLIFCTKLSMLMSYAQYEWHSRDWLGSSIKRNLNLGCQSLFIEKNNIRKHCHSFSTIYPN